MLLAHGGFFCWQEVQLLLLALPAFVAARHLARRALDALYAHAVRRMFGGR